MLGIPIIPCVAVCGIFLIASMWSLAIFGPIVGASVFLVMLFVLAILRFMSVNDDHRLNQVTLYLRSWPHRRQNMKFWGAHSMSPTNLKKRKSL